MKFALFHEIPVARPWAKGNERTHEFVMHSIEPMGRHVLPAFE